MGLDRDKILEIIDALEGSCMSLDKGIQQVLEDENADDSSLSPENRQQIDYEIFLCDTCGWWCESSQQSEDGDCEDCNPEDEDEEDDS